jgi:rfaE bifunctional protein nucleotidyltransferase chain/domain
LFSENLKKFCQFHHSHGKKIIFTNGCFDILHRGHVEYLMGARALGDALVLGLNSDQSVSRLKGSTRPINNQEDRKYILESLKCVDCVEIFDEDTPLNLIKFVKPTILVKGGDYDLKKIVGYDFVTSYGGEVKVLNFVPGKSTSLIISKILEQ